MLNSAKHEIYHIHKCFKMPTSVGILTFISMINTTSESLKARKVFIFQHFNFYEQLKFHAHRVPTLFSISNSRTFPGKTGDFQGLINAKFQDFSRLN